MAGEPGLIDRLLNPPKSGLGTMDYITNDADLMAAKARAGHTADMASYILENYQPRTLNENNFENIRSMKNPGEFTPSTENSKLVMKTMFPYASTWAEGNPELPPGILNKKADLMKDLQDVQEKTLMDIALNDYKKNYAQQYAVKQLAGEHPQLLTPENDFKLMQLLRR